MENLLTNSLNLSVTTFGHQGLRNYMEDNYSIAYQKSLENNELSYVYFAIFDGHGGDSASVFAKNHLLNFIIEQEEFWSLDDNDVKESIRKGFLACHHAMWKNIEKWPKTSSGLPSTSGTTASVAFIKNNKLYIGHCGDSGIILGRKDEKNLDRWKSEELTIEHKPESPEELKRITECGGKVYPKQGIYRVVWFRNKSMYQGPIRRSTKIEEVPFLAVARSLGDLWSYNYDTRKFVVSPEPDVTVMNVDINSFKCLVLASDGLWNVMDSEGVINIVCETEKKNRENEALDNYRPWINPSQALVEEALSRWDSKELRADNVSVVCVMFNSLLKEKVTTPALHQISSVEVEQHIMLDHCYEESFKLRLIDNLSSAYEQIPSSQESHMKTETSPRKELQIEETNFYEENVMEKSSICQNVDLNETIDPECSTSFCQNTSIKDESKLEEFYSKTPKIHNKENSKLLKKIRVTNNNNKFYETRQKDRKMRSGHVLSNTLLEKTRRKSAKLPIITENNQDNIKRLQKKIIGKVFQNTSEENCRILRKSFCSKDSESSPHESPLAKNSKYLKLNNIFLSKKKQKLYGTKSTKRLNNSEKFIKKNSKN